MTAVKKKFPLNYPTDVLNIIDAMSFSAGEVVVAGSMALRSQLYAGDYDMFEEVKSNATSLDRAVASFKRGFQNNIRQVLRIPDCYIGDIKCGEIPEWTVVRGDIEAGKVVGYDAATSRAKLEQLEKSGVLSAAEAEAAKKMLVASPTPAQFLMIQKDIRPQTIRWRVSEVLAGAVRLRDGRKYTLEEAIQSPALCKMDVVGLVQKSRFTDFSILYEFQWRGKVLNKVALDPVKEIKKNIVVYEANGDFYKMAKRIFSLAKGRDEGVVESLTELFNGDLGRLYSIISDIGSILFLLENEGRIPLDKIRYEVGQFRARLGNVYETDRVNTERTLMDILALETKDRTKLRVGLETLDKKLRGILNREAQKELKRIGLLPVPKAYLP